jgi:hypothetical protein
MLTVIGGPQDKFFRTRHFDRRISDKDLLRETNWLRQQVGIISKKYGVVPLFKILTDTEARKTGLLK